MSTIYLNLGSNLGDRRANIERAILMLASRYPRSRIRRAPEIQPNVGLKKSSGRYCQRGLFRISETAGERPLTITNVPDAITWMRAICDLGWAR